MSNADPLMAAFRQIAAKTVASRAGHHAIPVAKDGKDKSEHFREQLRSVAQTTKPAAKQEEMAADIDIAKEPEIVDRIAEIMDDTKSRSKVRDEHTDKKIAHKFPDEPASPSTDWHSPDAVLSAVVSRLDQAQASSRRSEPLTFSNTPTSRGDTGRDGVPSEPDVPTLMPKVEDIPQERFARSVDAVDTRATPILKVAVRDQETHFEPVQQVTMLQKIVDRMVSDLPAASMQASSSVTAAAPDLQRMEDKPLRMLTLQLDPPNLGTVTVKMRLAGDAVEVHMTADRYETTQMLRHERSELMDAMQSAGYTIDIASIDHSRAADANPNSSQPQGQADQRSSQHHQGASQFDNGTSDRQSNNAQSGARHDRQEQDQRTGPVERQRGSDAALNRDGSTLYL